MDFYILWTFTGLLGLLTLTNKLSVKVYQPGFLILHITLFKMYSYTSVFLRSIRKTSRMDYKYQTRAWIIALEIKSRPMKYRQSRAGCSLFYYIASIVKRGQPDATKALPPTQLHSVNRNNLWYIMTVNTNNYHLSTMIPYLVHWWTVDWWQTKLRKSKSNWPITT